MRSPHRVCNVNADDDSGNLSFFRHREINICGYRVLEVLIGELMQLLDVEREEEKEPD